MQNSAFETSQIFDNRQIKLKLMIDTKKHQNTKKIGYEIATILKEWRPDMNHEDIASALIHALERLSIEVENSGESKLAATLFRLKEKIDERMMSI